MDILAMLSGGLLTALAIVLTFAYLELMTDSKKNRKSINEVKEKVEDLKCTLSKVSVSALGTCPPGQIKDENNCVSNCAENRDEQKSQVSKPSTLGDRRQNEKQNIQQRNEEKHIQGDVKKLLLAPTQTPIITINESNPEGPGEFSAAAPKLVKATDDNLEESCSNSKKRIKSYTVSLPVVESSRRSVVSISSMASENFVNPELSNPLPVDVSLYSIQCNLSHSSVDSLDAVLLCTPSLPRSSTLQPRDITMHYLPQRFQGKTLEALRSLPIENKENDDDKDNLKIISKKARKDYIKLPMAKEECIVGSRGGAVGIAGSYLKFKKNVFNSDTNVAISYWSTSQVKLENDGLLLTPIVESCTGKASPSRPYTVVMPTSYALLNGTNDVYVNIEHSTTGRVWEHILRVKYWNTYFIQFDTDMVGRFRAVGERGEIENLSKALLSIGFLKRSDDSNTQTIIWCVTDNSSEFSTKLWFEMSTTTIYERVIEPEIFFVRYNDDLNFSLKESSSNISNQLHQLSSEDVWMSPLYKKFEFKIERQEGATTAGIDYMVRNNHDDKYLCRGSVTIEWYAPQTQSSRHTSICNDLEGTLKRQKNICSYAFPSNSFSQEESRSITDIITSVSGSDSCHLLNENKARSSESKSSLQSASVKRQNTVKSIKKLFRKKLRKERKTL